MKTIIVPTDFSVAANNAAHYAVHLAKALRMDITLCHAIDKVPADTPLAEHVVWPMESYASLKRETTAELKLLAEQLTHEDELVSKNPANRVRLESLSIGGQLCEVAEDIVNQKKASLVVMGMSGHGAIGQMVFGSNARLIVDAATYPVLMIPPQRVFRPIQKIAFATDLDKGDMDLLQTVSTLAGHFNAEILLAHVTRDEQPTGNDKRRTEDFLSMISSKALYPKIYYRHVKGHTVEQGLNWLNAHGDVDILVIVHRKEGFFKRLFEGSHTQKMAHQCAIPLLVLPEGLSLTHF
ncbi:MAG: universal stress protein [Mucilaginibacter sp.]|uniref:universal stress protein n=1 Tax=Mucilaginibacter sp. TaxID=1882438 RepID=UPI003263F34B